MAGRIRFAGDREVASDAVAEAFAQALRRGDAIRSPERWLWRTIFRIAAGELKQTGRHTTDRMEGSYEMNDLARDLLPTAIGHGRSREAARGATKLLVVLWWQQSGVPSASASDSWSGSWRQEVTTSPRAAGPHFHPSWVVAAGAHVWLLTIPRNDKSPMAAPENDWFQLPALRGSQPPLDSATDACRALRRWTAQHSQSA